MMVSISPWWWMPLAVLGETMVIPPQMPCEPASSRETAAMRCMPGVCAVLASNWWGLMMRTVGSCCSGVWLFMSFFLLLGMGCTLLPVQFFLWLLYQVVDGVRDKTWMLGRDMCGSVC